MRSYRFLQSVGQAVINVSGLQMEEGPKSFHELVCFENVRVAKRQEVLFTVQLQEPDGHQIIP